MRQPFFAQWFFELPAELAAALGTVLGFALLGGLTADQQNALGNLLMLTAQVLETAAAQGQLAQDAEQSRRLEAMQRSIDELRARLDDLQPPECPPAP